MTRTMNSPPTRPGNFPPNSLDNCSAPPAPATAANRRLTLAERGLGAQQVLQGLLLVGKSLLPFLLLQFFGGRSHGVGGRVHVLHKTVKFLVFLGQLAALHTPGQ